MNFKIQYKPINAITLMQQTQYLSSDAQAQALSQAIALHRNGDFQQAEKSYRQLLSQAPSMPDAWSLLGLVLNAQQRYAQALEATNNAIALNEHPKYLSDRSVIFLNLGKADLAAEDAKRAVKLEPTSVDAYINWISALRQSQQQKKAFDIAIKARHLFPNNPAVLNNYGACLLDKGDSQAAKRVFLDVVALDANQLAAHENIAKISWAHSSSEPLGLEWDIASAHARTAFELGSHDFDVLRPWLRYLDNAKGLATLATNPDLKVQLWERLLLQSSGAAWLQDLEQSDTRNTLYALAISLQAQQQFERSSAMLKRFTELKPTDASTWNNLGVSYFAAQAYDKALDAFVTCESLQENFAMAWRNIGVCHFMLIHPEPAREAFLKSYELDATSMATQLYLFGQSLQCCEWSRYETLKQDVIIGSTGEQMPDDLTASLAYLAAVERASDMRKIAPKVAQGLLGRADSSLMLDSMPLNAKPKIRLGYFSYDFRTHPVGYLTQEIYALHDRSQFEVLALSYGPDDGSVFRQSIEKGVDRFVDLRGMTTSQMVQAVRELDIDILIDLTGNTQGTRSQVVMHRLAPIQCHWLGYVWSMGHASYDYLIADSFSVPERLEHGYVERLARLPFTLQVASRQLQAAPQRLTRASQGLPDDAFVMCNFGSFSKLQPHLYDAWLKVLKAAPKAVLWLARTDRTPAVAFDRLLAIAKQQDIDLSRIVFGEPMSRELHLRRYELADLALDTYPQGSGTTAIEALWMGCPLLSMAGAGETLAVRMAGGILNAVHLSELVLDTQSAYEAKAIELATQPSLTSKMRADLSEHKLSLPLFNTPTQVQYLEAAFLTMVHQHQQHGEPRSFTVPS